MFQDHSFIFSAMLGLIHSSYPILLINNLVLRCLLAKYRMTFYLHTMILANQNTSTAEEFSTQQLQLRRHFI